MALVEKRARSPTGDTDGALMETKKPKSDALSVGAVPRTSTMQAPIMVLTGHGGEVRNPAKTCLVRISLSRARLWVERGGQQQYGRYLGTCGLCIVVVCLHILVKALSAKDDQEVHPSSRKCILVGLGGTQQQYE